ncbi:sirA-like protein [Geobacter sp. OR-1]|uniref:sulfurtransferase TusA family protein n=1 Tax=Geobacter sp. OR-1 TaxID=1266765 RepID=UPI00054244B0|nr:sulfurtransferase TusA family protein [Geobacter sp. OR-1]GAM10843.1 sirA-like protein [Geobacter sp. OR-1]
MAAPVRTIEFDIRGQICPSTLLVALREINKNFVDLNNGTVQLVFRTDNRDSTTTIPESAGNMGLHCSVMKNESCYMIQVSNHDCGQQAGTWESA